MGLITERKYILWMENMNIQGWMKFQKTFTSLKGQIIGINLAQARKRTKD